MKVIDYLKSKANDYEYEQIENLYKRIDKILDYINDCPSDKYLKSSKIIELLNGEYEK